MQARFGENDRRGGYQRLARVLCASISAGAIFRVLARHELSSHIGRSPRSPPRRNDPQDEPGLSRRRSRVKAIEQNEQDAFAAMSSVSPSGLQPRATRIPRQGEVGGCAPLRLRKPRSDQDLLHPLVGASRSSRRPRPAEAVAPSHRRAGRYDGADPRERGMTTSPYDLTSIATPPISSR